MSSRRKEYLRYLKSSEWSEVRIIALERTSGHCQFCGDFASEVHHVQYPKQFGEEHPNSTVAVCKRCHDTAHGVLKMANELTNVERYSEISPSGTKLNYLLSDEGKVYASAKSWSRALRVPDFMIVNFETGLARMAILRKDSAGGQLEMRYANTPVYRWHAVAAQLRTFDREFGKTGYASRPPAERRQLEEFHENYERLINWGYDLQERAIAAIMHARTSPPASTPAPVTQDALVEALKEAVAPRLHAHDNMLVQHDAAIEEIKEAIPALRNPDEFIPIKQAIQEQGLDPTIMPLHPRSRENLSGLTGQLLKSRASEQGRSVVARLDGVSTSTPMNTYRRAAIYAVLAEIINNRQGTLPF